MKIRYDADNIENLIQVERHNLIISYLEQEEYDKIIYLFENHKTIIQNVLDNMGYIEIYKYGFSENVPDRIKNLFVDNIVDDNILLNIIPYATSYNNISAVSILTKRLCNCLHSRYIIKSIKIACINNNVEILKIFHENEYSVMLHMNNDKAFRLACRYGNLEIVDYFINYIEDTNYRAKKNYAFRWACQNGFIDIAKLLIRVCPKINIHVLKNLELPIDIKNWYDNGCIIKQIKSAC